MNFVERFKLAWAMSKLPVYDMASDTDGFWTEDDARATALYFQSHSGTKLRRLLNNYVFRTCYKSVSEPTDHAYHAGVARGVSLTVFELQNTFSQVPAQRDDNEALGEQQPEAFAEFAA